MFHVDDTNSAGGIKVVDSTVTNTSVVVHSELTFMFYRDARDFVDDLEELFKEVNEKLIIKRLRHRGMDTMNKDATPAQETYISMKEVPVE